MARTTPSRETIDWVERLHALVDEAAAPALRANESRLQCRPGCFGCCADGLTVFEIEAAVIQRHHAELLQSGAPHPPGACALLGADGTCRVYAQRPYVCRTQGLPLRWLEEDESLADGAPELVEVRDVCPKNMAGGPPLEELPADHCWTIGPFEGRLAQKQHATDGGRGERVALRSLFATQETRRRLPLADG